MQQLADDLLRIIVIGILLWIAVQLATEPSRPRTDGFLPTLAGLTLPGR